MDKDTWKKFQTGFNKALGDAPVEDIDAEAAKQKKLKAAALKKLSGYYSSNSDNSDGQQ